MSSVLFFADLHVRRNDQTWEKRKDITGDVRFASEEITRVAREREVSAVVSCGDTSDKVNLREDMIRLLRRFISGIHRNAEFLYVAGNHDPGRILDAVHPKARPIGNTLVDLRSRGFSHKLYGLDYKNPGEVDEELSDVPIEAGIVATHQVFKAFMRDRGEADVSACPCPFVVSGDFHQQAAAEYETCHGESGLLVSPGPPCLHRWGEASNYAVVVVNDDLTWSRVPLRSRPGYEFELETRADFDALLDSPLWSNALKPDESLPEFVAKPVIRLSVPTEAFEEAKALCRDVQTAAVFVKDISRSTKPRKQKDLTIGEVRIGGSVPRALAARPDASAKDALRILSAEDPAEAVSQIYEEHLTCGSNGSSSRTSDGTETSSASSSET